MKKHVWLTLLVCILTFALMLCACDNGDSDKKDDKESSNSNITANTKKIEVSFDEALESLEKEGYELYYYEDDDYVSELPVGETEHLTAYQYDDYSSNDLTIIVFEDTSLAKIMYEQLEVEMAAEIKELELEIQYLETVLEKYADDMNADEQEEYEEELSEMKEELDDYEYAIGINGTMIWYGTVTAFEDANG